LILEEFLAFR